MTNLRNIAIIGIGPRGGYAVERLIIELAENNSLSNIHIFLYEATGNFGNGPVYILNQNTSNWINITERVLVLNKREVIQTNTLKIESFPSYHEWIQKDFNVISVDEADTYPPRAQIGAYLSQRFQSLIEPLQQLGIVSLYKELVEEIQWMPSKKIKIITNANNQTECDEVLLTIGHQPTELSKQILEWEKFVKNKENLNLFKSPYPVTNYLHHKNLNHKSSIGIRGFGLAMIDVVRAIAEKFGTFTIIDDATKLCVYKSNENLKDVFVPFSLDGMPPVPKPLNAKIDGWFTPSEASILTFEEQIGNRKIQKSAKNYSFLLTSFAKIAAAIYTNLPNAIDTKQLLKSDIEKLIIEWLEDQNVEHFLITSKKLPVAQRMKNFIGMATGKKEISLDYCIGQVWRHCQPSIYKQLSFNECSDKVFAEIIGLDESTKRYSYGPPVESIQQLVALADVGILNLTMVNDPTINLTSKGWEFHCSDHTITTTMMIDSVLDAPKIKKVKSALIKNMLEDDLIKVVQDDLGVATDENAYLISKNKNNTIPIALLGRLAKGTVIGVDAILECFGPRPRQWAKKSAANHTRWLNNTKL